MKAEVEVRMAIRVVVRTEGEITGMEAAAIAQEVLRERFGVGLAVACDEVRGTYGPTVEYVCNVVGQIPEHEALHFAVEREFDPEKLLGHYASV